MKIVKLFATLSILLFSGACKSKKNVPINSVRYTVTEDSKKYIPVYSGETRTTPENSKKKRR